MLVIMTRAREEILDTSRPGTYHLITRCVRRERLLERGERKALLCRGLASWLGHMAIDLLGYSVMGNHVHLVVRVRPDVVAEWSAVEVARHALAVLPVRSGPGLEPLAVTPALVERYAGNARWIAQQRTRLRSPSWLLRLVKQEVARRANADDGCTGHFWEKRFTSVALLDPAAVLACLVYVDLNPVRAGLVRDPVQSAFTSIRHRHARAVGAGRSAVDAEDVELGRRLVAMPQCAPVDGWSKDMPRWSISESDYLAVVQESARATAGNARHLSGTALALIQSMRLEPQAWSATMGRGGSMGGSVIGGPDAKANWCRVVGQKWAADKSGLWK